MGDQQQDVLSEAHDLIRGERLKFYGDPRDNLKTIARLWSAYLNVELTETDVCSLMVLLKAARLKKGYHRDSAVDICGYGGLVEVVNEGFGDDDPAQEVVTLSFRGEPTTFKVVGRWTPRDGEIFRGATAPQSAFTYGATGPRDILEPVDDG